MTLPEYQSIAEKKQKFLYVKADTKDVLDTHLKMLLKYSPRCIFRGVRGPGISCLPPCSANG